MKPPYDSIASGPPTSLPHIAGWAQKFVALHARIAPRFARPEPFERALAYMQGILSPIGRKNGWTLAEYAQEARPDGMQRLLSDAVWDVDGVRDDLRRYVLEHLFDPKAIIVLDESGFPKRGKKSAGVKNQHCGISGGLANCQVGVFLAYVGSKGYALIDRALYLPRDWLEDQGRCREAGIPEMQPFFTKCEQAQHMLERLVEANIPISWVVADTVYGNSPLLRLWLEEQGVAYGLAVACKEVVSIATPQGWRRVPVAEAEALMLTAEDWHRRSMSEGTKGPRLFDWGCVAILHAGQEDGRHFLLIRRNVSDPREKTYYLVFCPKGTTLDEMVKAVGARWHIEELFEAGKAMGLDHYEVRSFIGWYRHITLVLLTHAFFVVICAQEQDTHSSKPACGQQTNEQALAPLTVSEARHLLGSLIWPAPRNATTLLNWSVWRRRHRHRASFFHTKHRLQAG